MGLESEPNLIESKTYVKNYPISVTETRFFTVYNVKTLQSHLLLYPLIDGAISN